ncbi:MAG: hypothetical protein A2729_03865 [Candidatus Buchananbacteria bacterium RIFCSPHIGHO2_01_FULL_39_14]|uniref:Enoyl reductase (ER) domain-containing protein n=2 Tax=Candidatus Buchananiibacteriota TaxID=1817903 RepID=A0A1G1YPI3_9BACT|nr:MAG: hypothetical protein A2729_03865 [Candidatus Buchananbacteria bacterium RIFCSPHIGHO2_01_FULL_39_14]OGY48513.1 MAG: hypothetical protein A3D39_05045 [Candidatus Buchananbacteria bacterium RIFCSPHIGHO2_02_FULL_39_17]OGY54268.1 MAG: hypothetical protein A2912_04475 [Candidatus Buchananbacteria bacterium RIFCSPLOWO2_01_FULL_40_23b]
MKSAQINKYGGSEVVVINQNTPTPEVIAGKVLVEVYAAGINPADWKVRVGYWQEKMPLQFPATLGGDFSGVILEVGEGVSDFKKGDEVYGQASLFSGGSGAFAEMALADAKHIALKPKKVNWLQAAALPLAAVSAYQALIDHMNLSSGQKILLHGGAGGIGSFAIQLAKHLGADVATTAGANDLEYVKSLGAKIIIDYQKQSFTELIKDYDAVFDTVGGETYKKSFAILRKGGIIVSMLESPNQELMNKYGVKAISQFTRATSEFLSKLAELVDRGAIKVMIDKVFSLDQAGDALDYLEKSHTRGKVALQVK